MPFPLDAALRGARTLRDRAHHAYADVRPTIARLRAEGQSCAQIAMALNEAGHRTRHNQKYQPMQVWRILRLYCGAIPDVVPEHDDP